MSYIWVKNIPLMIQVPQSPSRHFVSLRVQVDETLRVQNVFDFVERFLNDPAGYQESTFTTATDSKQIIAFPVPASETLCFQSEQNRSHPFTIILYDLSGKEVCKREWLPNEPLSTIATSHLSNGMYFYSVANDGEAHFGKVIIQK